VREYIIVTDIEKVPRIDAKGVGKCWLKTTLEASSNANLYLNFFV
jgi:hypothetical protein